MDHQTERARTKNLRLDLDEKTHAGIQKAAEAVGFRRSKKAFVEILIARFVEQLQQRQAEA